MRPIPVRLGPEMAKLGPETLTPLILFWGHRRYSLNMTLQNPHDEAPLRADLLRRLAHKRLRHENGMKELGVNVFTYGCIARERIASVRMRLPVIGVVLCGTKEVWLGDRCQTLPAGSLFVLPRAVSLDVVNLPDERLGLYESLLMEMDGLPVGVEPLTQNERGPAVPGRFLLPMTRDLVEAVAHAAATLTQAPARDRICALRLAEIMMLLRHCPEARPLFDQSTADNVTWQLQSAPSEAWSVERVARLLGIGGSTLRRQLAAEGRTFRQLLMDVRMKTAHAALQAGAGSTVIPPESRGLYK